MKQERLTGTSKFLKSKIPGCGRFSERTSLGQSLQHEMYNVRNRAPTALVSMRYNDLLLFVKYVLLSSAASPHRELHCFYILLLIHLPVSLTSTYINLRKHYAEFLHQIQYLTPLLLSQGLNRLKHHCDSQQLRIRAIHPTRLEYPVPCSAYMESPHPLQEIGPVRAALACGCCAFRGAKEFLTTAKNSEDSLLPLGECGDVVRR